MNLKIEFFVNELPLYFVSHKNQIKSLEIEAFEDILTVFVRCDYDRKMLSLNANVCLNDKVEIILLEHRIELYINGLLTDEEWPAGNRLFDINDEISPNADICVSEYFEEAKQEPSVISTFENAEGWAPGNGVNVGDCMPYRRGDEFHVLYLKDRHRHCSKWWLGAHQWEHISTKDFKTWSIHPMAVPITDPTEASICTGSWIESNGTEYLFYTVRRGKGIPAPIKRSVSTDGFHFEKDKSFGFTVSDKYNKAIARDPKVIKGEDGSFHMFLTTVLTEENKGCLAHYVSSDLDNWEECPEPIYIHENADPPECPDYFFYNGKYYLIFSIKAKAHYMVSEKPFKGFVMPKDPIIPCSSVPKCAEWKGRMIFTGYKSDGGYAGVMTFKAATSDENGTLVFEEL